MSFNSLVQYCPEGSKTAKVQDSFEYLEYRGSPPYAHFGTWKKPCYMKFILVGLYPCPLLSLIPPLTHT